jgi:uncharacterized protein YmfQ (DUF2313 family)
MYKDLLANLLPPGSAWESANEPDSNLSLLLGSLSQEFERIDEKALELISEANPLTAFQLLNGRYAEAGLPNNCSQTVAATAQEKRAEVLSAWRNRGNQTKSFYLDLLAKLGVQATIDELFTLYPPFTCISLCNANATGESYASTWRINYIGQQAVDFKAGASTAGNPLGSFPLTAGFACMIEKLKPLHTTVIYNPVLSL